MSEDRYPLVKQMGLKVEYGHITYVAGNGFGSGDYSVVIADDLEAKLARAPVVYGTNGRGKEIDYRANMWAPDPAMFNSCDHHRGRIICIESVTLDTAESLLAELIKAEADRWEHAQYSAKHIEIINRAKKLLASATESK